MLHAQITPKCIEAKSRIASPVSSLNWSTLARKGGNIIANSLLVYSTDLKSFRTAPEEHRGSQIEINFIFTYCIWSLTCVYPDPSHTQPQRSIVDPKLRLSILSIQTLSSRLLHLDTLSIFTYILHLEPHPISDDESDKAKLGLRADFMFTSN